MYIQCRQISSLFLQCLETGRALFCSCSINIENKTLVKRVTIGLTESELYFFTN